MNIRTLDDQPGDFQNLRHLMTVMENISPRYYNQSMPCNDPDPRKPMCAAGHAYRLGLVRSVTDNNHLGSYFDLPPHVADGLFGSNQTINRILNRPRWWPVKPKDWIAAANKTIEEQKFVRQHFA